MRVYLSLLAVCACCCLGIIQTSWAQPYQLQILAEFNGTNGANPSAALLAGDDGVFYGTTYSGGLYTNGTIFCVTTGGVLTVVSSFVGTNGANPSAALVSGGDGFLYGTTYSGGGSQKGTVFKVDTNGNLETLASFTGLNGKNPNATLTPGGGGVFYGTTSYGYGTVFNVTTNGNLTTLVDFNNTNGAYPNAELEFGNDGLLYGTTFQSGTFNRGTVFNVTTNGSLTVMASFDGTNGWRPNSMILLGEDFYGTTYWGGEFNIGTIFKITSSGVITRLASFDGTNGAFPYAGLVAGANGILYGTTSQGGGDINGQGTVFSITTNGVLSTLAFFNGTNGANPTSPLVFGTDGSLYGTASQGGVFNKGTVFRLSLTPPWLNINFFPGRVVLEWTNSLFSLQSAPEMTGVFTNIYGASSPFTSSIAGEQQFFRLKK